MTLHKLDLMALLARVAGLSILASDATFQSSIASLAGSYAPKIIAVLGLVSLLATDVLRIIGSPTPTSTGAQK